MFVRYESFPQFLRYYPIISTLVGIHLAIFILCNLPLFPTREITTFLVAYNLFIYEGEFYRLITSIFTHIDFFHLLFNSFSLIIFGPILEEMLGKYKFIGAYLAAGIFANIATYVIQPLNYSHLGASGAIFGLFGIYLYIIVNRKYLMNEMNKQTVTIILVFSLIMTFLQPNINITAHIFGLLGGYLVAAIVLPNRRIRY